MAQYVYSMNRVGKIVPPKRVILKDISLSFFPGAKIGVLGVNGSGKSSLLRIMSGEDKDYEGEAVPMPNMRIGYLPQEPQLAPDKTVRETIEEGLGEIFDAKQKLEEIYAAYAEPDADFDKLASEQARYEAIIAFGLEAALVDGQDVRAVNEVATRLVKRARAGEGPAFLQADTYRYSGHHVGDINREYYRTKQEEQHWKTERDPIKLHASWLLAQGHADAAKLDQTTAEARTEMEAAVKFAIASPYPSVNQVEQDVYA